MKRNNLYLSLILVVFTLFSCTHRSYRMQTQVNRDGSCVRSISVETRDSAFIAGDTTANPLPIQLDTTWTVECYNGQQKVTWPVVNFALFQTDTLPRLTIVASRRFPSVEAMAENFHFNHGLWSVCKPSIIFKKEFRWFYTYYSYTETYPPFSVLTKIPLDHYLTSEEQTLWFQGNDPAFQGKNGTELCDLLSKIEPKAYLWLNHNLFAESYAAIDRLLPDHPFKNRFEAARDSIFRLNQDKYDALDAKLPEMLDNYFKTDYFSRHGQRIDSLDDPELNHKLDSLDLYEITFQYELLLPGKILSSNTRQTVLATRCLSFPAARLRHDSAIPCNKCMGFRPYCPFAAHRPIFYMEKKVKYYFLYKFVTIPYPLLLCLDPPINNLLQIEEMNLNV